MRIRDKRDEEARKDGFITFLIAIVILTALTAAGIIKEPPQHRNAIQCPQNNGQGD